MRLEIEFQVSSVLNLNELSYDEKVLSPCCNDFHNQLNLFME